MTSGPDPADELPLPEQLVSAEQAYVRRLARRLVANEQDADDVVQDVWMEVLQRPPRRRDRLRAWLRVVVLHAVARRSRGEAARGSRERAAARAEAVSPEFERLELAAMRELLERCVGELRPPYREIVEMRVLEGHSIEETAMRLGRPRATVRVQLMRGLAQVRQRVRARGGERSLEAAFLHAFLLRASRRATQAGSGAASGLAVAAVGVTFGALLLFESAVVERASDAVQVARQPPPPTQGPPTPEPGERFPLVPVSEEGSLLVRALRSGDGVPVVGMSVHASPTDGRSAARELATDERGEIRWSGLAQGTWRLRPWLGDRLTVEVVAGVETQRELVVSPGVSVAGRVVLPTGGHGRSEIWVSYPDTHELGRRFAWTEADGSFQLELDPRCWIAAIHDGHPPTAAHRLDSLPTSDGRIRVELAIAERIGALAGRVIGPAGELVPGARVVVEATGPAAWSELGLVGHAPELETTTDARGEYRLAKTKVGRQRIVVDAPGYAPTLASTLGGEGSEVFDVRLERGIQLSGTVRMPDGTPAGGALVRCRAPTASLPDRVAVTDAQGDFRIEHMPRSRVQLSVVAARENGPASFQGLIQPRDGAIQVLQLSLEPVIRGQLLDRAGAALGGIVLALDEEGERDGALGLLAPREPVGETTSASDGSFAFPAVSAGRFVVRASTRDGWPLGRLAGVQRGPAAIEWRLDAAPRGSIRGRFARTAAPTAAVALHSPVLRSPLPVALDAAGHFDVPALPAAEYTLRARLPGSPAEILAHVALEDGEARDLGAVFLSAPASLALDLRLPPELALASSANLRVDLRQRSSDERMVLHPRPDGGGAIRCRVAQLPPGSYELTVSQHGLRTGIADVRRRIELEEGETSSLVLDLEPGLRTRIEIVYPPGTRDALLLHARLSGQRGVVEFTPEGGSREAPRRELVLMLARGSYRLEIRAGDFAGELELEAGRVATLTLARPRPR